MEGEGAVPLPQELPERGEEVGFEEAREGVGELGREIGRIGSVESFQGLDGLDCFDAQDSTFHQRSSLRPRSAAPHPNVATARGGCGGGGGDLGLRLELGFKKGGALEQGQSHR